MCIDALNGMADTIVELERKLAEREWNPCSKGLPSDKTFVLVTTNDKFWVAKNSEVKIAECFYGGDYWLDRDNRLVDPNIIQRW